MSTLQAIGLGVLSGLLITGVRVAWVLWTTRLNTLGDYWVSAVMWWYGKRGKR